MSEKLFVKGNEAVAMAAIEAGLRCYFGYPITPQSDIPEYLSRELPKHGGTFIQVESEIGAINMVLGASAAGVRAMTSSSGPGISLKQEGISYMAGSELPGVIVDIMRQGPGLGGIDASQADYWHCPGPGLGAGDV
jgi:2-oxoglutarate ferredoxin oxidoreductase subunit alpha